MSDGISTRHFAIERIAPGVHVAIAKPAGAALCNSGIVDLGQQTLVFDSMLTPTAGEALARAARRLTGRSPDWVVNSHWHGDHVWGNASLLPAHIVSTRRVRSLIRTKSRRQFEACRREFPHELKALGRRDSTVPVAERLRLRAWFTGVLRAPRAMRIVPPDVTFEETLRIAGSRRTVELMTFGGGHSPSDVFAHLPEERLIFAGDLAMVGFHPSVTDGYPAPWSSILARMEQLRPEAVLPGHGTMGPGATLRTVRRYLEELTRLAAVALQRGVKLSQVRRIPIPSAYADWQFSFMFPDNIARAYRLEIARSRGAH